MAEQGKSNQEISQHRRAGPSGGCGQGRQRPPLLQQAWDLGKSLAAFAADKGAVVSQEQYRQRLEICDSCDQRQGNRCLQCGCYLTLKARGRAFRCPLDKWPSLEETPPSAAG